MHGATPPEAGTLSFCHKACGTGRCRCKALHKGVERLRIVFTPEALRNIVAQVGASQIVIGTDHPIPWNEHPVDHVMATKILSGAQKAAILSGNAAKLRGIKA